MDLYAVKLDAIKEQARPLGDSPAEQALKYNFHRKANGTLQYYIDKTEYLSAYVLAYSFFEDRIKALAVVIYRDLNKNLDFSKSINIELKRLIGNIYKSNENFISTINQYKNITSTFIENMLEIVDQRNKLLHEAMWRINAIQLRDIDTLKEATQCIYSQQRILMRLIKDKKSTNVSK